MKESELLDHDETKVRQPAISAKLLNTIVLILPFVVILFTIWKVWSTRQELTSPWLPEYTIYFINGRLINFTVLLSFAILPALIFRLFRFYWVSSAIIGFSFLGAFLFREVLNFYPHVFNMLN